MTDAEQPDHTSNPQTPLGQPIAPACPPARSYGLTPTAPYAAPPAALATGSAIKRRNVVAVWLGLPLVTLGIYTWVWWYKINAEMGRLDPRRPVSAGTSLLAITLGSFLIVPPYISVYNTGKRIAQRQHAVGIGSSCSPVIGVLLVFVFGLYSLYYQSELNKISDHLGSPPAGTPVRLTA
ncbi:MAG: DUF4234 domain-containing protein [Actinomycetota bacterium]|nr:DUF4234 domain-containing protein [Actinomycetota bacterium]